MVSCLLIHIAGPPFDVTEGIEDVAVRSKSSFHDSGLRRSQVLRGRVWRSDGIFSDVTPA